MADVKKTVEIALKIVGIDLDKINSVSAAFTTVQKSIEKTTEFVGKLQKSLDSVKAPKYISQVITSLQQIDKIKVPNLTNIANGFDKLGKMVKPPDISPFVKELQKFSGIKLPHLTSLVNGFKKLTELNVNKLINKIRALNTALAELDKRGGISAFKNFARDVTQLKSSVSSAASSTQKMSEQLRRVGQSAQDSGIKLRTFGDKVRTVLQFRIISEALMNVRNTITAGVSAIVDYSQSLKDLQAITGATSLEVAQMGVKILEVASTTKFSAAEVALGMRTIGQAGFSATEAVETMQAVSDLATGTLSDMGTTVDLVTTAMRVFQIDATESSMVADIFASAVNRSKLTIDKLRTAMNYIGPIARDSGVSFKELSASMMTLANSGLRASTIGTGLRRVFAELIDPSKKLSEAASKAGISLNELDPRATSLSEVLSNLNLVVDDAQVAFDIFGKRGASAALALSGAGTTFQEMLQTVDRSGIAAQQAAIQMEGLAVSFKNLKDKLGTLAIALGEAGIADIMKALIDLARQLVDGLIYLTNTALGKFIIQVTLTTASIIALVQAFKLLKASAIITPIIAAFESLVSLAFALETTVGSMALAFAPYLVLFAALAAAVVYFFSTFESAKEASDNAAILADSYSTLLKKMENYNKLAATASLGSDELLSANKSLREELLKTANEFSDVSEEAKLAALSIDPLTGKIAEGSKALEEYNKKLEETAKIKLVHSAELANKAYRKETSHVVALIEVYGNLKKAVDQGSIGYEDLKKRVAELSGENGKLNKTQRDLIEQYNYITEISQKIFTNMQKWGTVNVDETVKSFEDFARTAGYSGIVLEGIVDQFIAFKKANEGTFSNIIEKWANDGEDAVVDFIEEYKKVGGTFAEGEEAQLRAIALNKKRLVSDLQVLKERQAAEQRAGVNIELTWKRYYAAERELLKEAALVRQNISENISGQNIKLLIIEREKLEKELAKFAITYKNNAKLRIKYQEEATREYLKKEKELIEGVAIDPKEQKKAYESNLQERETLFAKHLENIAGLESDGVLTSEQAEYQKLQSTVDYYKESYREALKYQSLIQKTDDPTEYEERRKVVLKAEEAYYKIRAKFLNTYTDQIEKANKFIIKDEKKVTDEKEKHAKKQEKIKKDLASKILAIDEDYADKKEAIEVALQKKLKVIDEKIADNRKSETNDVLSLESSTEEKIRQIRKKGLSDIGKETSDKDAANRYLREGRLLLAQADKEKDDEKLERGRKLIEQSESIGQGLKNENDAVKFLRETLKSLKDARNIEAEIEELELLKQKEEEVAEAAAKQAQAKEAYEKKVFNATTAIDDIKAKEDERHDAEMANLDAEIEKYREKVSVAREFLEKGKEKGGLQEVTDSIEQENERHQNEIDNIGSETSAIMEKYNTARQELDDYGLSQEELDMPFDQFFESLTGTAKEAKEEVKNIMADEVKIEMDNSELEDTQEILEEVDNTILDVLAKVIGKSNVDALKTSIDRLKSKTITITTRYVTQGAPQKKRLGGRFPGYGGGDRNPVLAEDGEWFIRKEAVRKYGDAFLSGINNMSLPKFQTGGKVGIPGTTGDKPSGGISETLVVRFQAGGIEAPVKITDTNSRMAIKNMANELTKMRLIYAR